jgi:transposase
MGRGEEVVTNRRVRRWRSISEKLQIVQLRQKPGSSVAEVARAHGVNANQVFKWRRTFERGELVKSCALLPVTVSASMGPANEVPTESRAGQTPAGGAIDIAFPGRAVISTVRGADPVLLRAANRIMSSVSLSEA